jgi:aspartyl-tRNA(Asn)/glutamyl-tRNA(Gln) amidotransferase subunit A
MEQRAPRRATRNEAIGHSSIAEVAPLIAARKVSPVELVRAHLDRIDALDSKLFSFITVLPDRALAQAREAEREIMAGRYRGPLHGVPYSLKDNYYTRGIRTTAASRVLWDWTPDTDATIHARLADAGAILLGKNNTWEFGTGTGELQPDLPYPAARNPWDLAYFAAGSSTGTGVAVAAGLAMFGMGSDTGGSVRAPSACNGLFGLKPTYSRLSRAGILPNSFSFDAAGPLARTARDAAVIMQAIAGHDALDPTCADAPVPDYIAGIDREVRGLRIGVIRRFHERDVVADPEIVSAMQAALDTLSALGAELVELDVPYSIQDYRLMVRLVGQAEALSIHEDDFRERNHLMGPALRDKCLNSITLSATDFVKATRWRREMMAATDAAIASCDAVVCGGSLHAVPLANDEPSRIAYMLGSATCCFNVSGHPAAAICTGFDSRGLPMTMQIVGKYFDEATVLRVAAAYEAVTRWYEHHPSFQESPAGDAIAAKPTAVGAAHAPSRDEVVAILRRMGVKHMDEAMIDRATALGAGTAAQIARLPIAMPRDLESAHVLSLGGSHVI